MKIGLVSTYSLPTPPVAYGGEVYYWGLAKTLGEMGHEVHLFAAEGSQTPPNGELHIISAPTNGRIDYSIEANMELKFHDLLMSMDIVHSCSLDHIEAERLRYLYNKREIINTINGRTYQMPRPPFNVVTGSKAWQEDALRHGLQTEMIPWGIDTDFYFPQGKPGDYYLWISRFHPDKGLDLVLDLAETLGFHLIVAGSMAFSDHAEHGKRYLEKINTLPNVEYVALPDEGHHIAKRELYRKAKAFIYPVNYFECFGMVVMEAMACGCPVITTSNGAMPELVPDGVAGFICENKRDFARVILEDMPKYCRSSSVHSAYDLRKNARAVSADYTWVTAAKAYEKLYQEVIEGKQW